MTEPLRCKLGWHDWYTNTVGEKRAKMCTRCEKKEIELVPPPSTHESISISTESFETIEIEHDTVWYEVVETETGLTLVKDND